jgi:hypothetical protein
MKDDKLKKILEKYKLDQPLSRKTKKDIIHKRKKSLIAILKKKNKYSTLVLLSVTLLFWFKRFGISISLTKSSIVIITGAIIATSAITTVTTYTIKNYFIEEKKEKEIPKKKHKQEKVEKEKPVKTTKPDKKEQKYVISMIPFEYDKQIADIGKKISSTLYKNINSRKDKAVYYGKGNKKNITSRLRIVGSVIKLGEGYFVTAKIIDIKDAKVKYHVSENAKSVDDIPSVCEKLARKLTGQF